MRKLKHGVLNLYIGNRIRAAVEAIRSFDLILPNGLVIVLDNCHYAPSITRGVVSLSHLVDNGYMDTFMNYGISVMKDDVVSERRNQSLVEMIRSMMNSITLLMSFWGYALESVARILNMVPTKKVDKTPYEIWNGKVPNMSYLKNSFTLQETSGSHTLHEASRSDIGLKLLQELDIQPSNDTSKQHNEVEPNEVEPHSIKVPIRRSERIYQAPDIYGFYVDVEEHELGDLNEPPNYKVSLSYPEFDKGLDAMNAEMQSMKDN
ncbi:zinc finger, CCHC-type containing protein [Tanacetum coccineum]